MMTEHAKIGEDFKAVLQSANVSLPAPEQPDAELRAEFSKLQEVQGSAFDRAYLSAQLDGHKEAVAILRKYAKTGRTPQLKEFAQRTLPTIEQHQSELTDLSNRAVATGKAPTGTGSRAIGPPAEPSSRDKKR
jgi:putative membrane protein